jgi:hypothetical protein
VPSRRAIRNPRDALNNILRVVFYRLRRDNPGLALCVG